MKVMYVKPLADKESISMFEKKVGKNFPKDFVHFFEENNGGRPDICNIILNNGTEKVLNNFLSFNESDRDNVYKARKRVEEDGNELIPFASDPAGNYFCLKNSEVVFLDHENGEEIPAASSFAKFLEKLQ